MDLIRIVTIMPTANNTTEISIRRMHWTLHHYDQNGNIALQSIVPVSHGI